MMHKIKATMIEKGSRIEKPVSVPVKMTPEMIKRRQDAR